MPSEYYRSILFILHFILPGRFRAAQYGKWKIEMKNAAFCVFRVKHNTSQAVSFPGLEVFFTLKS